MLRSKWGTKVSKFSPALCLAAAFVVSATAQAATTTTTTTPYAPVDPNAEVEAPQVQRPVSLGTASSVPATPPSSVDAPATPPPSLDAPATMAPPAHDAPMAPDAPKAEAPVSSDADLDEAEAATATPAPRVRAEHVESATTPTITKKSDRNKGKIEHKGFVLEGKVGALGCTRSLCRSAHKATPGLYVGGFLGANVKGWLELGVQGGWGTMKSEIAQGSNLFDLYGLDQAVLEDKVEGISELTGMTDVQGAQVSSAHGGPGVRIHFIPRGRVQAYVGSGIGYQLYRTRYDTPGGQVRFDFHGFNVPIQAGLGAFITKRVALGAEFNYLWSKYAVAGLDHPERSVKAPVKTLESAAGMNSGQLAGALPHFWTVSLGLKIRI